MVQKKDWNEFRNTGLLLFINQILHAFGWAIVFEVDDKDHAKVKNVYPARVKFRGFDNNSIGEAYRKMSEYMLNNAQELNNEAQE